MDIELKIKNGFYTNVLQQDPQGNEYEFCPGLAKAEDITIRFHHMFSYNLKERFDKNLLVRRKFFNSDITNLEPEEYNPCFQRASELDDNAIPGKEPSHLTFFQIEIDGTDYIVTNFVLYEGKPIYLHADEDFNEYPETW